MYESFVYESFLLTYFKSYQNENISIYGNLNTPPYEFVNHINDLDKICIEKCPIITVNNM